MADLYIAICDDDAPAAAALAAMARRWAADRGLALEVRQYPSAEAFLFSCPDAGAADILLLDVEMPGMSGMALARQLRAAGRRAPIVFISGHSDYLADGYDVEALHYLLKPVDAGQLAAVLDRARAHLAAAPPTLTVDAAGEVLRVALDEIRYLEVMHNNVTIHAKADYTVRATLQQLQQQLGPGFFRIQRSYLVNLRYLRRAARTGVQLQDGTLLPLARGRYDALHRAMIEFF